MKLEFIPKFVTLLAGAVVCIITIAKDMDVTYSLELLLGTLIIFYIIGIIAKKIIQRVIDGNMFVKQQKDTIENPNVSKDIGLSKDSEKIDNSAEEAVQEE